MIKVFFTEFYPYSLREQVNYISKDKPIAAKKFKKDLILSLKKDLQNPFHFKKSIHFNDEIKEITYSRVILQFLNMNQRKI